MWSYLCIGFIDFLLKGKSLLEYTILFLQTNMKRTTIYIKMFSVDSKKFKMIKIYCIACDNYRKFKNPEISYILKSILGFSIVCSKCGDEYKKICKIKNQLKS